MIPRVRRAFARAGAVLSLAASCAGCQGDSDPQSATTTDATTTDATTTPTASSTTGLPTTSSATAATTSTTAATNGTSSASSTASSSASSDAGGASGSTSGTTGVSGAAGDNADSSTATSDGSGGTTSSTTGGATTGGTTAGVLVLEDDCSHEACGGALPNTAWRHTRACVRKDQIIGPIQSFCPAISLVSSGGELLGTVSFADDTYNQDVSFSLWIALDVPAECDVTCASFGATLAIMGFPGATCEESNDVCHCVGSAQGTDPRSGDYATSDDGTLTFVFPYGGIDTSYCVDAGSLSYLVPVMLVPQGSPMDVVYEAVPQ